jgi:epsilon-lactone hydrolase
MPSRRHDLLAWAVPRVRGSRDLDDADLERARIERWHAGLDRSLPTRLVPRFAQRFSVVEEDVGFPVYVITPRHVDPVRTVVYLHGGGFVAPIDPFHVRYAARLARTLQARIVMPDYPLAPEHTWRDSFGTMTDLAACWAAEPFETVAAEPPQEPPPGGIVLAGDSAGGGYALAVAQALRDRGLPQATHLLLHAPWVDLTTSTPETAEVSEDDPWLFLAKLHAYAEWWAGSVDDLGRPEVSPALGDLSGLPPALMFCGTRDTLMPGCRLLTRLAAEAGWELEYVEVPDLIHVFPMLPFIPEARRAWRQTLGFLQ